MEKINIVELHQGKYFYLSRIYSYLDVYKSPRTTCCRAHLHSERSAAGFHLFQTLLKDRGTHYNTVYTLLCSKEEYKGKREKHGIRCETHQKTFFYSMKDLNTITSCPCPECRSSPYHRNIAVPIVKKRNAGREGQVLRHGKAVKNKFNSECFLSGALFNLHYHHLDSQQYYKETSKNWDAVGICLNATIHRDYHNNFLPNVSTIKKEYQSGQEKFSMTHPLEGAKVSRYTFLEYLKFLLFDIQYENSTYMAALAKKMQTDFSKHKTSKSFNLDTKCFDLSEEKLLSALEKYRKSFVGENWIFASNANLPFANDLKFWEKVENTWNDPLEHF